MRNTILTAIVLATLTGGSFAQEQPRRPDDQRPAADRAGDARDSMRAAPMRARASKLIGANVKNAKGETLGEIEEVVLDNRRVSYAVLSFGGVLGIGEKYFAVPCRMIRYQLRDKDQLDATLDLDKETLKNAPGFDKTSWPDTADQGWISKVEAYYKTARTPEPGTEETPAAPPRTDMPQIDTRHDPKARDFKARRLSKLIGVDIVNPRNQNLGEVEDIIVDLNRGTVDAALIGYGGVLGIGEKQVLVPFDALAYDMGKGKFVLPANLADLDAVAFKGALPPLSDDTWVKRSREHFTTVETNLAKDTSKDLGTVEASGTVYTGAYDAKKTETIKGTIVTVGTTRAGDRDELLRLRIHADDGREVIVYGAPWTWSDQQALALRPGKSVEVMGSPTPSGRNTVLVAGTIKADGKTVKLRDDEGRTVWSRDGEARKQ